ncbi:MAG: hypothetical protein IKI11_09520, partial [Neisseriaceae bacterium]|nr:hypothetical protein [Neisseriaceae bacterium]
SNPPSKPQGLHKTKDLINAYRRSWWVGNPPYNNAVGVAVSACGVDCLLIFKKIPPYRAVGGLTRPPYKNLHLLYA